MFDSNYLYFLHIPLPPNLYDLKGRKNGLKTIRKMKRFNGGKLKKLREKCF